jgi:hypothetical protein
VRSLFLAAACAALLAGAPARALADGWRSEQPVEPAIGVQVPLGPIGDVEFWEPNRGMLITAGNDAVPAGLYAYDGSGWYPYATVCGGTEGRIAWAGPDDFWTIADQQKGQETGKSPAQRVSLCHFVGGQVVASYAKPVGVAGSYLPMNAAACAGPSNCWFAGERLPGTVNAGAFHLHWDGTSLTEVPSLTEPQAIVDPGRTVTGLAFDEGGDHVQRLYEGVQARAGDIAPEEPEAEPSFVHEISLAAANPFLALFPSAPLSYGAKAVPTQLEGFRLSDVGEGLWAVSGALKSPARVAVMRLVGGQLAQVPLLDTASVFAPGDAIRGAAAEPGTQSVWVSYKHSSEALAGPARITRIHADGRVDPPTVLPAEGSGMGSKGAAGPLACSATDQCWLATSSGWLFHLGPDLPANDDPAMHTLITSRPADESLPFESPITLPEDDSGAYSQPEEPQEELEPLPVTRQRRALVADVSTQVIGRTTLELTFTLRAKAKVRLVARWHRRTVATTAFQVLGKGRHSLRLRLDPERWPTKLDLQAHAVAKRGKR